MSTQPRHPHPALFMFLIIPFGVLGGYLSVCLGYQYSKAGVAVEQIAGLIALGLAPHAWKFLWAPVADTTLSRRSWYAITCVLTSVGIFATGVLPVAVSSLPLLTVIVLVSNIASTFLGMAVESMMAYGTPENEKGRAGGWFQAGSLGGGGLGGGLGLALAQRLPAPWMSGAIVGALCLACMLVLFFIEEPQATHRHPRIIDSLKFVGTDVWEVARSRMGFLALCLCFTPLGSGAASGLWSAVAKDWSASADTVALVTGLLAGIVSAAGCLAGGWMSDRMDRKLSYVVYSVFLALCAAVMAWAPHSETNFIIFTTVYAFIGGLTYAGFSAFVLEAMGLGAAATKYNVFASLSNMPILYMTKVDGWAHTRYGPSGMLYIEALSGVVGFVVFMGILKAMPKRDTATA